MKTLISFLALSILSSSAFAGGMIKPGCYALDTGNLVCIDDQLYSEGTNGSGVGMVVVDSGGTVLLCKKTITLAVAGNVTTLHFAGGGSVSFDITANPGTFTAKSTPTSAGSQTKFAGFNIDSARYFASPKCSQ